MKKVLAFAVGIMCIPLLATASPMKKISFNAYLKSYDDKKATIVLHEKRYSVPRLAIEKNAKTGKVVTVSLNFADYKEMKKTQN